MSTALAAGTIVWLSSAVVSITGTVMFSATSEDANGYAEHWEPVLRPAVDQLLAGLDPLTPTLFRSADRRLPRLLDLGTGTGQLAFAALDRWPAFDAVAIDADPEMLAVAERRAAGSPARERLSVVQADAEALPFEDEAFDVVASSFVIDQLDRPKAFREVRRVLRPSGAFASVTWLPPGHEFVPRRVTFEALADVTPAPVIGGGITSAAGLARQLRRAGFRRISAVAGELEHEWSVDGWLAYIAGCGARWALAGLEPEERHARIATMRQVLERLPPSVFTWRRATVFAIAER